MLVMPPQEGLDTEASGSEHRHAHDMLGVVQCTQGLCTCDSSNSKYLFQLCLLGVCKDFVLGVGTFC